MITQRRILALGACVWLLASHWTHTLYRVNIFRPYDINIIRQRKPHYPDEKFLITGWAEFGVKTKAYNREGDRVNPLQIFQPTFFALPMFFGVTPTAPQQDMLIQRLNTILPETPQNPGVDDPMRGHLRFTGDLDYRAGFGVNAWYQFPHDVSFGVMVPFYSMTLKNVRMKDLTSTDTLDQNDVDTREFLTDHFEEAVALFDPKLNLHGWKKTGIGDITTMLMWQRRFPQGKPWLKNVTVNGRIGISWPTGVKTDIDDLFSIPLGFDGSTAVVVAGGIDLDWHNILPYQISGGLDVQFWHLFSNTRERRIRTNRMQTDLFYLAKERANINPGFMQTYNLYLELHKIFRGLSLSVDYEFIKQSRSHITLFDNDFSELIADSAKSLKAWKVFQFLFAASYDCAYDLREDSYCKPQFKAIFKLPIGGKRVVTFDTFTIVASVTF